MRRVIAFDVNETLLDLAALDPDFHGVFGHAAARWGDEGEASGMRRG